MQLQKAFVYYRKNYLLGVARPGALVYDGVTLNCYGNDLQQIFSVPVQSVTIKEGFGIFKVIVDGAQISILTPVGGGISPSPSEQLNRFLQTSSSLAAASGGIATGSVGAAEIGNAVSSAAPVIGAVGVGIGVVGQAVAIATYIKGQDGLREFFRRSGFIKD
jgi:hypothetical protein